eukprot:GHVR01180861.1.p1 GENE.GHVR01180861.1~~GHVR01180861.1.p1  ORF type:complete len:373 (-),score=64.00 GHVR01180861.1:130-1248(-)
MTGKKKAGDEDTDVEITLERTWKSTKNLENKVETIAALCMEMREMNLSRTSESEEFKMQLSHLEKLHNIKLEDDERKNKEIEDIKLMNQIKNKELDEVRLANLRAMRERAQDAERNKEMIETEIARLREKDHKRRELPVKKEVTSEEDSDDESIGLDSDGEIPDYSQYTKEQLELQALKSLAKRKGRKYSDKKVTLTKNIKSKEESLIVRKLSHIHSEKKKSLKKDLKINRISEMRVNASAVVPLIQNGGTYNIVMETLLPRWKDICQAWINDKTVSKKERILFRDQIGLCIAVYSGAKIMGEKNANILKAACMDIKDGALRSTPNNIIKAVEEEFQWKSQGSGNNNQQWKKGYNNKDHEEQQHGAQGYHKG